MKQSEHARVKRIDCRETHGFSLMEVVTALSVISFALVALLGVFPIGLENSRTCINETRAAQLSGMVFSTLRGEPFKAARCFGDATLNLETLDNLNSDQSPETLYVSYGPNEEPSIVRGSGESADTIYRIQLRFEPKRFKTASGEQAGANSPVTGSTVHFRMFGMSTQQPPIFETSTFIASYQRLSFAQ